MSVSRLLDKYHYVYSCDLDVNVQIKIGTLEGERENPSYRELMDDPMLKYSGLYGSSCADLFVTCQIFSEGHPLSLAVSTSYKAFTNRWNWNEWLTLPVKYSDLTRNAVLVCNIWDIYGTDKTIPVGGTTLPLFGKRGTYKKGMHDLRVWPKVNADPKLNSTTPGKIRDNKDQMNKLSKLCKKHKEGHMLKVDWLDRLTYGKIENIKEQHKRNSNFMFLMLEFPEVCYSDTQYTIVYFEKDGDEAFQYRSYAELVTIPDPEILEENLVERKHHKLARSLRSGPTDKELKPDAKIRDHLNDIVGYPPNKQLTSEEEDLLWKFRFYLSNQKKALTKFLHCVNWSMPQETKQALDLMSRWSPIDAEDALELLSLQFQNPHVRRYAVSRLRNSPDENLLLYLLQLVQALKYEDVDSIIAEADIPVKVSSTTTQEPTMERSVPGLTRTSSHDSVLEALGSVSLTEGEKPADKLSDEMDLATFLISRSCENSNLANYFYWYLTIEAAETSGNMKNQKYTEMYHSVLKRFDKSLLKGNQEAKLKRSTILRQQSFMDHLIELVKMVTRESANRKKKIEKLQGYLHDTGQGSKFNFSSFETMPLPLDPEVKVNGIIAEEASLFKSKLMPCKLIFRTTDNKKYATIFKHGDDLRQDQLVLQMITLMDKLLMRENLDLKLSPYKALAMCNKNGFIQFVDGVAVAYILEEYGSIQNFFRKHSPCEGAPLGILPEVMDNYIKSIAGYSVITFLLGVGDRHLDNILLSKSGKLFHIDFGYILGRDPKPMPPPMKLSAEMIDGFGGTSSEHFMDLKKLCYTSFLALRRYSNLILNLFSLMIDANIPDIALEPDKTVRKVQDKFVLHLSDEEAVQYMQNVIDVSVSAMMPALIEQFHRVAQYWRK